MINLFKNPIITIPVVILIGFGGISIYRLVKKSKKIWEKSEKSQKWAFGIVLFVGIIFLAVYLYIIFSFVFYKKSKNYWRKNYQLEGDHKFFCTCDYFCFYIYNSYELGSSIC